MLNNQGAEAFTLFKKFGEGGFGAVYKAQNNETGDTVALKVIPNSMEKKYRDAFVREHNLQRQFEHKHLCSAYGEVGQDYEVNHSGSGSHVEGSVSAQEPLSAGSLFDFVVHSGPFEEDLARHYFAQLCSGLY